MNSKIKILLRNNFKILLGISKKALVNSRIMVEQNLAKNQFFVLLDMFFSFLIFGADASNYRTFEFYKLNFRGRNAFITRIKNTKFRLRTSEAAFDLFYNKSLFNLRYSAFIKRNWVSTRNNTSLEILDFINKYKTVIVKPDTGTWGIGIYKLNYLDKDKVDLLIGSLNNGKEYVIEEIVENIESLKLLNPTSLNTLRVITMVDRLGHTHIIKSLLRIGATNSCVDNTSIGGLICSINEKFGIIDSVGKSLAGPSYFLHPISQKQLLGLVIPYWEKLENYVEEITKVEPKARYVGWDIAITNDGFELIEGNLSPGELMQISDMVGKWKLINSYV